MCYDGIFKSLKYSKLLSQIYLILTLDRLTCCNVLNIQ